MFALHKCRPSTLRQAQCRLAQGKLNRKGVPHYLPCHKAMMSVWIAEKTGGKDINNLGRGLASRKDLLRFDTSEITLALIGIIFLKRNNTCDGDVSSKISLSLFNRTKYLCFFFWGYPGVTVLLQKNKRKCHERSGDQTNFKAYTISTVR